MEWIWIIQRNEYCLSSDEIKAISLLLSLKNTNNENWLIQLLNQNISNNVLISKNHIHLEYPHITLYIHILSIFKFFCLSLWSSYQLKLSVETIPLFYNICVHSNLLPIKMGIVIVPIKMGCYMKFKWITNLDIVKSRSSSN